MIRVRKRKVVLYFKECAKKAYKQNQKALTDKNLAEAVALLTCHFTKLKNKFYKKVGGNGTQINRDNNNSNLLSLGSSNASVSYTRRDYDWGNL